MKTAQINNVIERLNKIYEKMEEMGFEKKETETIEDAMNLLYEMIELRKPC